MKLYPNQPLSTMKFKIHTTPVTAALVLSLTGLIALQTDLIGEPLRLLALTNIESSIESSIESVETSPKLNPIEEALLNPKRLAPLPPEQIDVETLWLARVIFSESKRIEEQALVAWVVRNRVESHYRGKRSYEGVALDPYQFSAFSHSSSKRSYYSTLTVNSKYPGWQAALSVAYVVRHADASHSPFSQETRHFYSERSLGDHLAPKWAMGQIPVAILYETVEIDIRRFRFFEGIS
jgi:hypothetical protein